MGGSGESPGGDYGMAWFRIAFTLVWVRSQSGGQRGPAFVMRPLLSDSFGARMVHSLLLRSQGNQSDRGNIGVSEQFLHSTLEALTRSASRHGRARSTRPGRQGSARVS